MSGDEGLNSSMARRTIAGVVTIVLAFAAASCGDDDSGGGEPEGPSATDESPAASSTGSVASTETRTSTSTSSASTSSSSDVADDEGAFPLTIEHKFGSTTIPEKPQRIVTLGFNEHDFVLALDEEAVAVREYMGYEYEGRPWAQEHLGDETSLPTLGAEEISFEKVAAADPDLILGVYSFMEQSDYEKLSDIAPTIAQTDEYPNGGVPWDEQMLATGDALGMPDKAAQIVDDVDAEFEAARQAHPEFDGATLAVAYYFDGNFTVLEPADLRARFFTDLGFEPPPETGEISAEQIDLLDHDVLVVVGATRDELADHELLASLDASTEGRVVFFGGFDTDMAAALGYGSPLSLSFAIDTAVPLLTAAVDGDPSTPVDDEPLWADG